MLDNNVWTYVGERGLAADLEALERATPAVRHVVAPSVLLEALRTPLASVRDPIVAAMTSRRRERVHPLPEARQEADELVSAIRLRHPEWLRQFTDAASVRKFEAFWTRRIWQLAAADPDEMAARQYREEDEASQQIAGVQKDNRRAALDNSFRLDESEPWALLEDLDTELRLGWNGTRIESWRVASSLVWWDQLVRLGRRDRSSYADWVRPWVSLDAVARRREVWNRFWYHEVAATDMPRVWMRSVLPWAQIQGKVGDGDPRDAQHAAYLFDVDVFVTADRRYARALELARRWSATPFAAVDVIPATGNTVAEIREVVARRLAAPATDKAET